MSGMQLLQPNDVKIYNLTAGKALPSWLTDRKRRQLLKRDVDLQRRLELIQDFDMPTATSCIRISPNGEYVTAGGTYKPRMRCYELDQMSMKFERYLQSEIVDACYLSEDYTKQLFILADRSIELHAAYGHHYRTRTPKCGRALRYNQETCDAYVVGSSPEIYRLNLDQGRFLKSWETAGPEINSVDINPFYGFVAAGTTQGFVETFDPRTRARVGMLDISKGLPARAQKRLKGALPEVTTTTFFADNLSMAVGTSSGHVLVYDVRNNEAELVKDHNYGLPIKRIHHHHSSDTIASCDSKVVKFWEREGGKNVTALECEADINDMEFYPDSGLFFVAGEQSKIMTYFMPSLAPAPAWAHYLDSITEELEDDTQPVVYDDYKFVTREDLEALDLGHLIGTGVLKASMHGFYIDNRLYNKAKELSNPFAYEEYRRDLIKKKLEEGTESRLQLNKYRKELPKINRMLAKRLMEFEDDKTNTKKSAKRKAAAASTEEAAPTNVKNPLGDDRFAALFQNPDFQIDMESEEYKLRHPAGTRSQGNSDLLQDKFSLVDVDDEDEVEGREERDSDDDLLEMVSGRKLFVDEEAEKAKARARRERLAEIKRQKREAKKQLKMLEVKEGEELKPMTSLATATKQRSRQQKKSFAKLVKQADERPDKPVIEHAAAGGKVITFSQAKKAKPDVEQTRESEQERKKNKRGVKGLKLSSLPKQAYWRGKPVKRK
eukprot:TRINITY_DN8164_c0_g1_i1.p1 TRINITY_DN8164_c0_g1~~TRINITY_DN8164_c0_g1_i1.p1  ORF type:complete len:720 (+),score=202.36 TRINITY_DN8164_c0_g1_i1:107-2266(+)